MDYDSIVINEGKKFLEMIPKWLISINNRQDVIKLLEENGINGDSNSIIKVLIVNFEMVLGIGQKPIPYALNHLRFYEPIKSYLKLTDTINLTNNAKLEMPRFIDNIGRDQHKNSYGDFDVTINLSELYDGIKKLYKTDCNIKEEAERLFISFFHDDNKIFNNLCNKFSPEDITKLFNYNIDYLKDDEDNVPLFEQFLKYKKDKGF